MLVNMDGRNIDTLLTPYPLLYPQLQKSYIPVYRRISNSSAPLTSLGPEGVYALRSTVRQWVKPGACVQLDLGVSLELPPFVTASVFQPACSNLSVRPLRLTAADFGRSIRITVQNLAQQDRLIRFHGVVAAFHLSSIHFLPIKEDRAITVFGPHTVGDQAREFLRNTAVHKFYQDCQDRKAVAQEFEKVLIAQATHVQKEREGEADSGVASVDLSPLEEEGPAVTVDIAEERLGQLREVVEGGRVMLKRTLPTGLQSPRYFTAKYAKKE